MESEEGEKRGRRKEGGGRREVGRRRMKERGGKREGGVRREEGLFVCVLIENMI